MAALRPVWLVPLGVVLVRRAGLAVPKAMITWKLGKITLETFLVFRHCEVFYDLSTVLTISRGRQRQVFRDSPHLVHIQKPTKIINSVPNGVSIFF